MATKKVTTPMPPKQQNNPFRGQMSDKIDKLIVKALDKSYRAYARSFFALVDKIPDDPQIRANCLRELTYRLILTIMHENTVLYPVDKFVEACTQFQLELTADLFSLYHENHEKRIKHAKEFYK